MHFWTMPLTCALVLMATGCGDGPAPPEPEDEGRDWPNQVKLAEADPDFRLTADVRAQVPGHYDIEALERFLAWIHPAARPRFLRFFLPDSSRPGSSTFLVKLPDAHLQGLLDEVYAPLWKATPKERLEYHEPGDLPGRETQRIRRQASEEEEER